MVTRVPRSQHRCPGRGWWRSLHLWQRIVVVAVVLGALAIGAGLIYYGPRLRSAAPATTTTAPPAGSPGADPWNYWGQNKPLDQQP